MTKLTRQDSIPLHSYSESETAPCTALDVIERDRIVTGGEDGRVAFLDLVGGNIDYLCTLLVPFLRS